MRPDPRRIVPIVTSGLVLGALAVAAGATGPAAGDETSSESARVLAEVSAPARYDHLRARVYSAPGLGTIAVGAPTPRRVMVQRLDEASGTWSQPRVLFRSRDRTTCGDIAGRTSPGGIALLLECDTPYYEDQAPASSRALVTRDLESWRRSRLPGEAYGAPAISPDGSYAAWSAGGIGSFVEWSSGSGFSSRRATTYDSDSGGQTLVVTDDGTVSVLGPESSEGACVVGVHDRTVDGRLSSAQVDVDPGCTEGSLLSRNALEVEGGGYERAYRFVLRRADDTSAWEVAERVPATAPGLVPHEGSSRRVIRTAFSDVVGQTLVAYGSPDRRHLVVQRYDDAAQEWGAERTVYDHGFAGCAADHALRQRRLRVHAISLHCYPVERADGDYPPHTNGYQVAPRHHVRMVVSSDGLAWRTVVAGARPVGTSADGALVAVPGPRTTTVVSPSGVRVLPARAAHRCGFVFPLGTGSLLRVHGYASAGWPRVLQRYDGRGWRTIQRLDLPRSGSCREVRSDDYRLPSTYLLRGDGQQILLRVVRRDGAWRAVRTRGY